MPSEYHILGWGKQQVAPHWKLSAFHIWTPPRVGAIGEDEVVGQPRSLRERVHRVPPQLLLLRPHGRLDLAVQHDVWGRRGANRSRPPTSHTDHHRIAHPDPLRWPFIKPNPHAKCQAQIRSVPIPHTPPPSSPPQVCAIFVLGPGGCHPHKRLPETIFLVNQQFPPFGGINNYIPVFSAHFGGINDYSCIFPPFLGNQ